MIFETPVSDLIAKVSTKHYLSDDAKARLTDEAADLIALYRKERTEVLDILDRIAKAQIWQHKVINNLLNHIDHEAEIHISDYVTKNNIGYYVHKIRELTKNE